MAGFEGTVWAPGQLCFPLATREPTMLPVDAHTPAVSRSIHYGVFLAFEGIRFFVEREGGTLSVVFVNVHRNLERFRRGISFNLSDDQQALLPDQAELFDLFRRYLSHPRLRPFLVEMAETGSQGYLRPFTLDNSQSIGVTFPSNPEIRIVAMRYDAYLGEPFHGVVVPWLVRTVGVNGTGCLKLGGNYLMSVKAVQAARRVRPGAASALFLDDRPYLPYRERLITEWDSSCSLIAMSDGSVVRIPDGPLILPSVTINGLTSLLAEAGVAIDERQLTYGELVDRAGRGEVVTVCSVGTAGIMARCATLLYTDPDGAALAMMESQSGHPLFATLGQARARYWDVYRGRAEATPAMLRSSLSLEAQNWMPA